MSAAPMRPRIAPWRIVVVYAVMLLFVMGIPSLPRPHALYWGLALLVETALCVIVLPFKPGRTR